jgi:5'-3' exoribonuclease 1
MPTLDIKEGGITTMFEIYKRVLPTLDGYLTEMGNIYFDRVEAFISAFGKLEDHILAQRFAINMKKKGGRRRNRSRVVPNISEDTIENSDKPNMYSMLDSSVDLLAENSLLTDDETLNAEGKDKSFQLPSAIAQARSLTGNELKELLDKEEDRLKSDSFGADDMDTLVGLSNVLDFPEPITGNYGLDVPLMPPESIEGEEEEEPDEANADDILLCSLDERSGNFDFKLWRKNYYMKKMKIDVDNKEQMEHIAKVFVEALLWMYNYYYHKCISWNWFYPYHYSPIASDLSNLKALSEQVHFQEGAPFFPFEQLLSVLPPKSSKLLPVPYNELVLDRRSPISDFYPEVVSIDREGTRYDWEGVVLLPFIDEERLRHAASTIDHSKLTAAERERNVFGHSLIFAYDPSITFEYKSSLPDELPDIAKSHVKMERYDIPQPPNGRFIPKLCDGVKTGCNGLEGFPSLFCREIEAEQRTIGVCLYAQPSSAPTLTISLDLEEYKRLHRLFEEEVKLPESEGEEERKLATAESYRHLLGKKIYIGYPYPRLAYVSSLSDEDGSFYESAPDEKTLHNEKEKEEFHRECNFHRNVMLRKYGIDVGQISVLLFVRLFKGMEKAKNGSVYRAFYADEFAYPAQLLPEQYNPVPDPKFKEHGPPVIQTEYPVDTQVIYIENEYYGCTGTISGYVKGPNTKLKVMLNIPKSLRSAGMLQPAAMQPNYPKEMSEYTASKYFTLKDAATKLNMSPKILGLIIGSVRLELPDGRLAKQNIGLQLRSSKHNKRIIGYCKLDFNTQNLDEAYYLNFQTGIPMDKPSSSLFSTHSTFNWQISDRAIDLIRAYKEKFPELFEALESHGNGKFAAEDLFPSVKQQIDQLNMGLEDAKKLYAEQISAVANWIHSQGYLSLPFMSYEVDMFPKDLLSKIEQAAIEFEDLIKNTPENSTYQSKEIVIATPSFIYKAGDPFPTYLCKRDKYSIGHRVINMAASGQVPFGMKGIIVGIEGEYAEVVFDTEFIGGVKFAGMKSRRGGICLLKSLLNLSRASKKGLNTTQVVKQTVEQRQQKPRADEVVTTKFVNTTAGYREHFYVGTNSPISQKIIYSQQSMSTLSKFRNEAQRLMQENIVQPVNPAQILSYDPAKEFKKIRQEDRQRSKYYRNKQQQPDAQRQQNPKNMTSQETQCPMKIRVNQYGFINCEREAGVQCILERKQIDLTNEKTKNEIKTEIFQVCPHCYDRVQKKLRRQQVNK